MNGIQEVSGSIPLISTKSSENYLFPDFFLTESNFFCEIIAFPHSGYNHNISNMSIASTCFLPVHYMFLAMHFSCRIYFPFGNSFKYIIVS